MREIWKPVLAADGIQLMESLEDRSTPLVRTLMAVWIPSEEEKQRIADGHPVLLWVWGTGLPPSCCGSGRVMVARNARARRVTASQLRETAA